MTHPHQLLQRKKSRKTRDPRLAQAQGLPMYQEEREHMPIGVQQAMVGDTGQVGDPHGILVFSLEPGLVEHR